MSGNPLDKYREFDPKLLDSWMNLQGFTFSEGVLSQKMKYLIAMAIDIELGSVEGATVLGERAIKFGALREEIMETLRVAYSIGGNQAFFTAASVVQNLFPSK